MIVWATGQVVTYEVTISVITTSSVLPPGAFEAPEPGLEVMVAGLSEMVSVLEA